MQPCYIGVDPGESGSIVALWDESVIATPMLENESAICDWLTRLKRLVLRKRFKDAHKGNAFDQPPLIACIEEQQPRPTYFTDKGTGQATHSILRSTCILYGNYRMMVGILTALEIRVEKVLPKKWQKDIGGPAKQKGEPDNKWKGRLRAYAYSLYPDIKIPLAISDALLIAHYCKMEYGTIPDEQGGS